MEEEKKNSQVAKRTRVLRSPGRGLH